MELLSEESAEEEAETNDSEASLMESQESPNQIRASTSQYMGKRGEQAMRGPSPLISARRSGGDSAFTGGARRKTSNTLFRELAEKTVRERLSSIEATEQETLSTASSPRRVWEDGGTTEQADAEEQDGFFEGMGINPALPPHIANLFKSRNRRTGMDALGWSAAKGYITVPGRTNLRFSRPPYQKKEYGVKDIEQILPGEPGHHDWTRYPSPDQQGSSIEEDENNNSTLLSDLSSATPQLLRSYRASSGTPWRRRSEATEKEERACHSVLHRAESAQRRISEGASGAAPDDESSGQEAHTPRG